MTPLNCATSKAPCYGKCTVVGYISTAV